MRITVLRVGGRACPHVCDDYAAAFRDLEHEVAVIPIEQFYERAKCPDGTHPRRRAHAAVSAAEGPDLVISYAHHAAAYPLAYVDEDNKLTTVWDGYSYAGGIQYASIWLDSPMHDGYLRELFSIRSPRHYQFIWDRHYVERFNSLGVPNSHYLPCAVNPKKFHPTGETAIQFQVCLAASWSPQREELVNTLIRGGISIAVFGEDWGQSAERSPDVYARYMGSIKHGELNDLFNRSMVQMNLTMEQGITSLNMRVFEVGAAGHALLITDSKEDLETLKIPAIRYTNLLQIAPIIKNMLLMPAQRSQAIHALRERIVAEHTYTHRAEKILEIVYA